MFEIRLGDVIDDYCIKCRRLTNHSIVSIVDGAAAKVRCRTCYNDHDYRNEIAPPTKKELKKLALFNEVLAGAPGAGVAADGVVATIDGVEDLENLDAILADEVVSDEIIGDEAVTEEAVAETVPEPPKAKAKKALKAK